MFHFAVDNIPFSFFAAYFIANVTSVTPYHFVVLTKGYRRGGAATLTLMAAARWYVLPNGEIAHLSVYSAASPQRATKILIIDICQLIGVLFLLRRMFI